MIGIKRKGQPKSFGKALQILNILYCNADQFRRFTFIINQRPPMQHFYTAYSFDFFIIIYANVATNVNKTAAAATTVQFL